MHIVKRFKCPKCGYLSPAGYKVMEVPTGNRDLDDALNSGEIWAQAQIDETGSCHFGRIDEGGFEFDTLPTVTGPSDPVNLMIVAERNLSPESNLTPEKEE